MSQALLVILSGTTFLFVSCTDGSTGSVAIADQNQGGRPNGIGTAPFEVPVAPVYVPPVAVPTTDGSLAASPVPEPMTMLLFGSGLVVVGFVGRRRRQQALEQGSQPHSEAPRLRVVS